MKKVILCNNSVDRVKLTDKLDSIYHKLCMEGNEGKAEAILIKYNASEDDSDEEEGFMSTMSDDDIRNAIREMNQEFNGNSNSVQNMIHSLQSNSVDASIDYKDGFLDACKMFKEEFGIELDGLDY